MKNRSNVATKLRTPETWERYQNTPKDKDCFMCGPVFQLTEDWRAGFEHWLIIRNDFPYDAVAEKHHLLLPKRHIQSDAELNAEEVRELNEIMKLIEKWEVYDCIMKNFPVGQSHPSHLHYHLLRYIRV